MQKYSDFIQNILNTRGRFNCGEEYHERHHIIPQCVGGSDDEENLIDLFAREHFEAHRLLALENPLNDKLVFAWNMMSVSGKTTKRYILSPEEYEELRKSLSAALSKLAKGRIPTEAQRKATSAKFKGVPKSDIHKKKISEAHMGIRPSDESRQKMSEWQVGELSPRARSIIQYDLECNYIRHWTYIKGASDELGISKSSINRCCQKDCGYNTAGGFIWRYADDPLTTEEIETILSNKKCVRGVYRGKNGKWFAKIGNKRIGTFNTEDEAIIARLNAQKEKRKEENYGT